MQKGRTRRGGDSVSNQDSNACMVIIDPSKLTLIRAKTSNELGKSAHSYSVYS